MFHASGVCRVVRSWVLRCWVLLLLPLPLQVFELLCVSAVLVVEPVPGAALHCTAPLPPLPSSAISVPSVPKRGRAARALVDCNGGGPY